MARPKSDVQSRILDAVEKYLRQAGAGTLTLGRIATETGCAKGLVNYHFKTKSDLLAAAADRLFRNREDQWKTALSGPRPETAIAKSWRLISDEVENGFWRALNSLSATNDELTVRTVNKQLESFSSALAASVRELLRLMGLTPSVSPDELGHLAAAAIHGFEIQLATGVPREHVESAHTALWVAILALTAPSPRR